MNSDYKLITLNKVNNKVATQELYQKYYQIIYYKAKNYSHKNKSHFDDFLNIGNLTFYIAVENYIDDSNFLTYLNSCLDNALNNYQRSLNSNKNRILNEALSIDDKEVVSFLNTYSDNYTNPEYTFFDNITYEELKNKIISKLTWKEELVFTLKEQNYSTKEIAEIIDNKLKKVYNIINRIQKKVSNLMSNYL